MCSAWATVEAAGAGTRGLGEVGCPGENDLPVLGRGGVGRAGIPPLARGRGGLCRVLGRGGRGVWGVLRLFPVDSADPRLSLRGAAVAVTGGVLSKDFLCGMWIPSFSLFIFFFFFLRFSIVTRIVFTALWLCL